MKKPIISKTVKAGSRIYYFDVRKDSKGNNYISVTEMAKKNNRNRPIRNSVFIHDEHIEEFCKTLVEIVDNHIKPKE